jgi:hypothetical protein
LKAPHVDSPNGYERELTFPFFLSSGVKWVIGGCCNAIFLSIPLNPNKKIALRAKYAFISAPGTLISNRVAEGGTEGGEIMRMDAARES